MSEMQMRIHTLTRPLLTGLLTACLLAGFTAGSAAAAATPARVQGTQELAVLLSTQTAHKAPEAGSPQVALVPDTRPITGERTTLPVLARRIGTGGAVWLQVMLPGRPDGLTGWITEAGTRSSVTSWRLIVNLGARRVTAYQNGRKAKSFSAVVGKPSTPTPGGQFFVEEVVRMGSKDPGGPIALALSARSNVFAEFEGGPGQIGIHGRDNLGGTLGQAESHGCVRLATPSIEWLAERVGPGTPVLIEG
jgi:lipoprotein-anchoring transpeptidase ErfK/SrfK